MNLYDLIYKRKSVRDYTEKKLSPKKLEKIRKYIDSLETLYEDIEKDISIANREKEIDEAVSGIVGSFGKVEAPHYIIISSEEKNDYLVNIGFMLEPVVLKLTSMGIGTCWLGSNFDEDTLKRLIDVRDDWRIPAIISMGNPKEENPFRDNPEQAKRKKLSEIIIGETKNLSEEWESILNAARLAPSAMNGQPWRFEIFDKGIHLHIERKGSIVQRLGRRFGDLEEMNKIDAGIALSHIKIAAEHFEKEIEFRKESVEKDDLEYIITIFEA